MRFIAYYYRRGRAFLQYSRIINAPTKKDASILARAGMGKGYRVEMEKR